MVTPQPVGRRSGRLHHRAKSLPKKAAGEATPRILSEAALARALEALRASDPAVIDKLLAIAGPPPLRARAADLGSLIWIIVSQQVSTASARAIFGRVTAQFPQIAAPTILDAGEAGLRSCGLSGPKIRTVLALCAAVRDRTLVVETLADLSAEDAHRQLVVVKGIGPWTADVFLLFCIGHPDIWPAGDLALREAVRHALDLDARPSLLAMMALGDRWRPYRGVAARVLWASYAAVRAGRSGMGLA